MSVKGSYLNPKKVVDVEDFLIPKFATNVRAFLGLHAPGFSLKNCPLCWC